MILLSPLRVFASVALFSLASAFAVSSASAAGVVGSTDTFGNNNFNGWTPSPTDHSGSAQGDVTIFNVGGTRGYVAWLEGQSNSGNPDAYITKIYDTAGYNTLSLSFYWEGYSTDRLPSSSQTLFAQWRVVGDSNWTTLDTLNLYPSDGFHFDSKSLFTNLNTSYAQIEIRFYTNVNDNDDSAKVDSITLFGTQGVPGPTPIPGALPLFMSGAAVFGGLVYRRKRKQPAA
jgi:hypothetical protein